MFSISRPHKVIPGSQIDKDVRNKILNTDTVSGRTSLLCENFQQRMIEEGTGLLCPKSGHIRINTETNTMTSITNPYSGLDGSFDWTEDFDGIQKINDYTILYNFKLIVEDGGSQTRSLKCVYDFVKAQRNVIHSLNCVNKTLFVNILDGKVCSKHISKFKCFEDEKNIYVGDTYNYFDWLKIRLETIL